VIYVLEATLMIGTTANPPRSAMPAHPAVHAEFLDFRDRSRGLLPPAEIPAAITAGRFVWLDIDRAGISAEEIAKQLSGNRAGTPRDCLHPHGSSW